MSTPIETNTEELQEILQTVYNLPLAGGGSSEPDLVIGVNVTNPITSDNADDLWPELGGFSADNVSIVRGSVQTVKEKLLQGNAVNVSLKTLTFYSDQLWSKSLGTATYVTLINSGTYSNPNHVAINASFFVPWSPEARFMIDDSYSETLVINIAISLETGEPIKYKVDGISLK